MLDAANELNYSFVLITYEQKEFFISPDKKEEINKKLREQNVVWVPLQWHSGKFKILKKAYDLFIGMLVVIWYRLKGYNRIVSLATVSGRFAYILSRIFRMRHYLYQFEPHSEFLKDFGHWSERSISYRILNWLEQLSGKYSEVVATGTRHMINRLEDMGSHAEVFLIPSCVDETLFRFSDNSRNSIRNNLGIENRKVVVYAGKFGGIYFEEETIKLFSRLNLIDSTFFFLILTPNPINEISALCQKNGLRNSDYHITRIPFKEMPNYLSAADLGVVSVPSHPSQKFRSPIKVGEYLCCGVPYMVLKGVSEDDEWAEKFNVGVAMEDFSIEEIEKIYPKLQSFTQENKTTLYHRCRQTGIEYRGFSKYRKVSIDAFIKI